MNKFSVQKPKKLYFTYPNTVTVICTKYKDNIYVMPAVWQVPLSHSPMILGVLISPKRNTFNMVKMSKNFTLNYFSYNYASFVAALGSCSGKEINKVEKFNIKLSESSIIDSPILQDASVSIECDKVKNMKYGDHYLFYGEAKNFWYNKRDFKDNIVNMSNFKPLLYLGNMTFTTVNSQKIQICKKK